MISLAMTRLYLMVTTFLGIAPTTLSDTAGGDDIMSGMLGVIATVARYAGIGLAAIGIWQFVNALQEGDGQGKGRAILFIVAGAAMFLMKSLLTAVFQTA